MQTERSDDVSAVFRNLAPYVVVRFSPSFQAVHVLKYVLQTWFACGAAADALIAIAMVTLVSTKTLFLQALGALLTRVTADTPHVQ